MPEQTLPHSHGQAIEKMLDRMPKTEEFQTVAGLFSQLGDSSRIRIFWLLCHCEECVLNIAALVNMTSPAVSHHLRLLKNSGLIVCRRAGKEMYYKTADTELAQVLHHTIETLGRITCPRAQDSQASQENAP